MNDQDLEVLLKDLESPRVERKESLSDENKIRQAICAFANDLDDSRKPGVLFVGAKDDGSCARLPITDQILLTLADIKTDGNILPLPAMSVDKRTLCGCELAVVIVQPSDAPPVKYKGRIWVRTASRRSIASSQDERILNEKRRFRDLPYDLHPLQYATVDDLNKRLFEEDYLPRAFAADVLEKNQRSFEERLATCRMVQSVDQPVPTVTGNLVLGKRTRDLVACAYVQRFGIGIQVAQDALRKNGNPAAVFTVEDTFVQVEIKKAI